VCHSFFKDLGSKTFLNFFYGALGRLARLEGFVGGFSSTPVGVRGDRGRHAAAAAAGLESEGDGRQVGQYERLGWMVEANVKMCHCSRDKPWWADVWGGGNFFNPYRR